MNRSTLPFVLAAILAGGVATVPAAVAQGNPPGTVTVSSAVTGTQQFAGDLDRGGQVRWSSFTFSSNVTRQFVPAVAAGFSLRFGQEDWLTGSSAALGGRAPWQRLQRPGAAVNLSVALSRTLLVGVSPSVEWAYDFSANSGDGFMYGVVLSAAKVVSPRLVLGGGASVTRQFYSVKTSPFVIVNWKLTDRLRIANASAAGPLGGAGVELRYAPTADWELAGGGVLRTDRWRLASRDSHPGNVGETSSTPLVCRLTRKLGARARVDLYGGVMTSNRLTIRDSDGREIAHDRYGAAPLLSATLSGKF